MSPATRADSLIPIEIPSQIGWEGMVSRYISKREPKMSCS